MSGAVDIPSSNLTQNGEFKVPKVKYSSEPLLKYQKEETNVLKSPSKLKTLFRPRSSALITEESNWKVSSAPAITSLSKEIGEDVEEDFYAIPTEEIFQDLFEIFDDVDIPPASKLGFGHSKKKLTEFLFLMENLLTLLNNSKKKVAQSRNIENQDNINHTWASLFHTRLMNASVHLPDSKITHYKNVLVQFISNHVYSSSTMVAEDLLCFLKEREFEDLENCLLGFQLNLKSRLSILKNNTDNPPTLIQENNNRENLTKNTTLKPQIYIPNKDDSKETILSSFNDLVTIIGKWSQNTDLQNVQQSIKSFIEAASPTFSWYVGKLIVVNCTEKITTKQRSSSAELVENCTFCEKNHVPSFFCEKKQQKQNFKFARFFGINDLTGEVKITFDPFETEFIYVSKENCFSISPDIQEILKKRKKIFGLLKDPRKPLYSIKKQFHDKIDDYIQNTENIDIQWIYSLKRKYLGFHLDRPFNAITNELQILKKTVRNYIDKEFNNKENIVVSEENNLKLTNIVNDLVQFLNSNLPEIEKNVIFSSTKYVGFWKDNKLEELFLYPKLALNEEQLLQLKRKRCTKLIFDQIEGKVSFTIQSVKNRKTPTVFQVSYCLTHLVGKFTSNPSLVRCLTVTCSCEVYSTDLESRRVQFSEGTGMQEFRYWWIKFIEKKVSLIREEKPDLNIEDLDEATAAINFQCQKAVIVFLLNLQHFICSTLNIDHLQVKKDSDDLMKVCNSEFSLLWNDTDKAHILSLTEQKSLTQQQINTLKQMMIDMATVKSEAYLENIKAHLDNCLKSQFGSKPKFIGKDHSARISLGSARS